MIILIITINNDNESIGLATANNDSKGDESDNDDYNNFKNCHNSDSVINDNRH